MSDGVPLGPVGVPPREPGLAEDRVVDVMAGGVVGAMLGTVSWLERWWYAPLLTAIVGAALWLWRGERGRSVEESH